MSKDPTCPDTGLDKLSASITHFLAAEVISNPAFPSRSLLPKPLPLPFDNFGHMLLVDYERLVNIVWKVALDARAAAAPFIPNLWSKLKPIVYFVAVVSFLVLAAFGLGAAFVGGLLGIVMIWLRAHLERGKRHQAHRAISRVRAMALEALLADTFDFGDQSIFTISPNHVGTGALGRDWVPVLAARSRETMFPGFGKLQLESRFVCGLAEGKTSKNLSVLTQAILEQVHSEISTHPEIGIFDGEAVVVHRNSLGRDSGWLDAEKAPRLWLSRTDLPIVNEIDPYASVRVFRAIQVVIPRYMAIATFFLRVFPVGKGVSLQIAAVTLGPPVTTKADVAARLFKYRREEEVGGGVGIRGTVTVPLTNAGNEAAQRMLNRLRQADLTQFAFRPFQDQINLEDLMRLTTHDEINRGTTCNILFQRVVDNSAHWPGMHFGTSSGREWNSYTLPTDFFGAPEVIALLNLIYSQITRAALKAIESGGFDISEYQDDKGRILIKADKIDQLVMGERIDMHDHRPAASKQQAPAPAAASAS